MDGSRFDALTRSLATTPSRRRLLKSLTGGAIAAIASVVGLRIEADAAPPVNCPPRDLCNGVCCPNSSDTACCAGKCVTRTVDNANCHACGKKCSTGKTCCSSGCATLSNDETNCGTCGHACPAHSHCTGGACHCDDGYTLCNGHCVHLKTNDNNCGSCGHVCSENRDCIGGKCVCREDLIECNGTCFDPSTSSKHCGSCNHACPAHSHCQRGQCTCDDRSQLICGGKCVDVSHSVAHCGACDNHCGANQICYDYGCADMCDPTQPACPGKQIHQPGHYCDCACVCPHDVKGCSCPQGTGCAATATCGHHNTSDLCCPYPQRSMACADSPGKHDGFALCCEKGLDCPHCPSGIAAFGGRINACTAPEETLLHGGSADCGPDLGDAIGGDAFC